MKPVYQRTEVPCTFVRLELYTAAKKKSNFDGHMQGHLRRTAAVLCDNHLIGRLDLRYTFPRIHQSAEPGKMPGSYRYCVRHSMQSSKAMLGRTMH